MTRSLSFCLRHYVGSSSQAFWGLALHNSSTNTSAADSLCGPQNEIINQKIEGPPRISQRHCHDKSSFVVTANQHLRNAQLNVKSRTVSSQTQTWFFKLVWGWDAQCQDKTAQCHDKDIALSMGDVQATLPENDSACLCPDLVTRTGSQDIADRTLQTWREEPA